MDLSDATCYNWTSEILDGSYNLLETVAKQYN